VHPQADLDSAAEAKRLLEDTIGDLRMTIDMNTTRLRRVEGAGKEKDILIATQKVDLRAIRQEMQVCLCLCLCLSLRLRLKGLSLYTVGILFHVEWCIR
jgi:hypothetical protein